MAIYQTRIFKNRRLPQDYVSLDRVYTVNEPEPDSDFTSPRCLLDEVPLRNVESIEVVSGVS